MSISLDSLPVAAAGCDRDGVVLDANRRFRRLFGLGRPNQTPERLADMVGAIYRPAVQHALDRLGASHEVAAQCSISQLRPKGRRRWLAVHVGLLGPDSTFPFLVCAQPVLKGRAEALPDATVNARHLGSQSWPPLLTTLSHEVRGPLNAICGWAAMADSGILPSDRIPRALDVIRRNAESLSTLVENLFDLSRHAAGALPLKLELLDLNRVVEYVVESTYPAAKRQGIALTLNCSRAALFVDGDRMKLEQVVRNLVDNAVKFTPAGGRVSLRTIVNGRSGELVVDDTGAGISRDLLPAIFDPFRQGVREEELSGGGVGLGLALVRELVHLHHGEVRAVSRGRGKGSTFTVSLPLVTTPRSHRLATVVPRSA